MTPPNHRKADLGTVAKCDNCGAYGKDLLGTLKCLRFQCETFKNRTCDAFRKAA